MGSIYYKETSRSKDLRCEQEINRFADKNFYPFFKEWLHADSVERVKDKTRQITGCDVVIKRDGKKVNIDEKATSHYMNTPVRNFAAEMMFAGQKGDVRPGWFANKELKTNAYIAEFIKLREDKFPFIDKKRNNENPYYESMVAEDITSMEVAVIGKTTLQNALFSKKGEPISMEQLEKDAKWLFSSRDKRIISYNKDLFMYHSTDRPESPVCLIIGPKFWERAAVCHCNVFSEGKPVIIGSHSKKLY